MATDITRPVAGLAPVPEEQQPPEELLPEVQPPGLISRALRSGGYGALRSTARFAEGLARTLGAEGIASFFEQTADRAGAEAERYAPPVMLPENIQTPGDAFDYYTAHLVSNLPGIAATVATGLVGRGIGGTLFRGGARKALAQAAGGTGGVYASTATQNIGEIYDELKEQGVDDFGLATQYGALAGALDALAPAAILAKVGFRPRATGVFGKNKRQLVADILAGIGVGSATEAVTESLQEGLAIQAREQVDPGYAQTLEAMERQRQAAIVGGLIGGTFGGAGGVVRYAARPAVSPEEEARIAAEPAAGRGAEEEAAAEREAEERTAALERAARALLEEQGGRRPGALTHPLDAIIDFFEPPPPPTEPIEPGPGELTSFGRVEQVRPLRSAYEAALERAAQTGRDLTEQEAQNAAQAGNFEGRDISQYLRTDEIGPAERSGSRDILIGSEETRRENPEAVREIRRQAAQELMERRRRGIPLNAIEMIRVRELEQELEAAAPEIIVERERGFGPKQPIPEPPKITAEPPVRSIREGGILGEAFRSKREQELVEPGTLPPERALEVAAKVSEFVGQKLDESGVLSANEQRLRATKRAIQEQIRNALAGDVTDLVAVVGRVEEGIRRALKGKIPARDVEQLLDEVLGQEPDFNVRQGALFSKGAVARAATARPFRDKIIFVHYGDVPGGVTDPSRIGTGVPGEDQPLAREFGLRYTSAVTARAVREGLYREPAVQSRRPYVGIVEADRLYNMENYRQDPDYERARELVSRHYGPDEIAALYQFQRLKQDQGYDGLIFPDGQLRLFKPQRVFTAPTAKQVADGISRVLDLHTKTGGASYSLATGQDLAGQPFYAVSPYKDRETRILGQPTAEQLDAYVRQNFDLLSLPGHYLGTWYNEADGYTYLDVSVAHRDLQTALDVARDAEQLAILDLRTLTEIRLNHPLFEAAAGYNLGLGLPPPAPIVYREVDPDLGRRVALAYDALQENNPADHVRAAYRAFADEVRAQFEFLRNLGFVMEPWTREGQPYANSAEMRRDVFVNRHLYYFTGGDPHPFLTPEENEMFRAVHDVFGHAKTGFEFGPRGELNAFRAHAQMFTEKAIPALATETLGHNSWVNFHPAHADRPAAERPFAKQKTDLLPDALIQEALGDVLGVRRSQTARWERVNEAKGREALELLRKIVGDPPDLDVALFVAGDDRPYAGRYTIGRYKDLIELAYNAKDILSVAAHEGYHFAEQRLLTEAEREVVRRGVARGTATYDRVLANARRYDAIHGTSLAEEIAASETEARAYAFEQWRRGELDVPSALERVYRKILEILERIRNFLDGLGFQSTQDIFRALDAGEIARRRAAKAKIADQSAWDEWLKNVEPDVIDGLEHYNSRLDRVEHYDPAFEHRGGPLVARGRPDQIRTRADLERIRRRAQFLVEEGIKYGAADWHARSARAAMMIAGNDPDRALTVAALIANYSPRTKVGDDLGKALVTLMRSERGEPLTVETIRAPGQHIAGAVKILGGDKLTGRKRVSFLKNMMFYIDPETFHPGTQGATVDMWMAHMLGFTNNLQGALANDAQYDWAEAELYRIARKLGVPVWEAQAAAWVALRARAEATRSQANAIAKRRRWLEVDEKGQTVVKKEKVADYLNTWMDLAMDRPFDPDAFREANISYLEAADKIAMGFRAVRRPVEFELDGKRYAVEDLGPALKDFLRQQGFTGASLHELRPRALLGQLFSRAAIAEVNAAIASGNFERGRVFANVRDAMMAAEAPEANVRALFGSAAERVKADASGIARFWNEWISTGIATADRSLGYRNVFNALSFFDQRKKRVFTELIERNLSEWVKHGTTDNELRRATRALLERTINEYEVGSDGYQRIVDSLSPKERVLFDQATRMIASALDAEFEADKKTYARLLGADSKAYAEWVKNRAEVVDRLKRTGYFPERRYGDHAVHVFVRDPKSGKKITLVFEQFESKAKALRRLNGGPGVPGLANIFADVDGVQVEYNFRYNPDLDGTISYEKFLELAASAGIRFTQAQRERVAKKLIDADSAKLNRIFRRENVPGMSEDGLRVLAELAEVTANRVAHAEFYSAVKAAQAGHRVDIQFTTRGIPQITVEEADMWAIDGPMAGHYRALADELVSTIMHRRPENVISGNLRAFASFQFLGGSVAAAMVNMTSIPMAAMPYLSQFVGNNPVRSSGYLLAAARLVTRVYRQLTLETLDRPAPVPGIDEIAGLRDAIKIGIQDGTLQDTEIYQFMGLSRGQLLTKSRTRRLAADFWMAPFRLAERFNRLTTFIAAYRIGMARNLTGNELYKFAQEAVFRTQLRYDEVNRPKFARNGLGAILMTFKTWPLGMLELFTFLARQNKSAAAWMLMSVVLLAGVEGLPFAEDVEDLVDTIATRIFGIPFNSKRAMRNWIKRASEAIGLSDMSGLIMHGLVNWSTGLQFASRVGMGNIIPGTRAFAPDAEFKDIALEVVGPVAGMLQTYARGIGHVASGDLDKAIREGSPLAVQNLWKGVEQMYRGYATDMGGRRLVDLTGWEAFMQTLGFSSDKLARAYEADRIDRQTAAFHAAVRREVYQDLVNAARSGDRDEIERVIGFIGRWNAANPDYPIVLNGASLRRQIALAGMTLNERTLRSLPRTLRGSSEAYRLYVEEFNPTE